MQMTRQWYTKAKKYVCFKLRCAAMLLFGQSDVLVCVNITPFVRISQFPFPATSDKGLFMESQLFKVYGFKK